MKKILLTSLIFLFSSLSANAQDVSISPKALKIIVSKHSTEYKYNPVDRIETDTLEHFNIDSYENGGRVESGQNYTYTSAINPIELLGTKGQEVVRSEILDSISIVYDKNEAVISMNYDVRFLEVRGSPIAQTPTYKTKRLTIDYL